MIGQIFERLTDELRRVWRYRWLSAGVAAILGAVAVGFALGAPSVYEAWGQLYVSRQTPLSEAAQGVSLPQGAASSSYVVQKTLLNDENLEATARALAPVRRLTQAELAIEIAALRRQVRVEDAGDGFVEIHCTDTDPDRAQAIVRLVLNQFVSGSYERSQEDLQRASAFLDQQVASYSEMIAQSQARLAALRARWGAAAGPAAQTDRDAAGELELVEAPAPPRPAHSEAAERVAQLEARLANLLTVDTEQHPDVVAARRQLEAARAQRDQEASELATGPALIHPPRLRRVRAHRRPAPPPAAAAELAELQHKDELLRTNYQQLVAKRAATQMSEAVSGADRAGKFLVTREPAKPVTPVGPNRKLYLAAGLAAALASGLGAGYLRAAVRGIMVSPREIEEAIQLPVIGTVSFEPAWRTRPRFSTAFDAARPPAPRRQRLRLSVLMEKAS
jgi:uncharacterized protein involved in exopolysaccharide biosynthesis